MCRLTIVLGCFALVASGATIERLSIEDMTVKSTSIVRGRVTSCSGELRRSVIYTVCRVSVAESWKGAAGAQVDVYVPGGSVRGLAQTFAGTPRLAEGSEYVLFLWAGSSGRKQVIGLSQGAFGIQPENGKALAVRAAADATVIDSEGQVVQDSGLSMPVSELRRRIGRALAGTER